VENSARCCALSALQCAGSDRMYAAPSLYAGLSPIAATPPAVAAAVADDGAMDADDFTEHQQQQHRSAVVTAPPQLQVSTTT
jgi:hypothetical protein